MEDMEMAMQEYSGNVSLLDFKLDGERLFLEHINIQDQVYANIKIINLTFYHSNFSNVTFKKCDLTELAAFDNTTFINCHFKGCKIGFLLFSGSHFYNCIFESCSIKQADFDSSIVKDSLFKKCKFNDVRFRTNNFINNKIIGKIYNSRFYTDLEKENAGPAIIDLSEATLEFTDFMHCDLSQAILPKDENMKFVHNLTERARKAIAKIRQMPEGKTKRTLLIYSGGEPDSEEYTKYGYANGDYLDYIFNMEQERKYWEECFDDFKMLFELD